MRTPSAEVIAAAQAAERTYAILTSIQLAQWADESGWGAHMPAGSNNPFGIKARLNGAGEAIDAYVESATSEMVDGRTIHIVAPFRKFASIDEAFAYHAALLATGKPYARARRVRGDYVAFAHALTGVYASDPAYGDKLIGLIQGDGLLTYDLPSGGAKALA